MLRAPPPERAHHKLAVAAGHVNKALLLISGSRKASECSLQRFRLMNFSLFYRIQALITEYNPNYLFGSEEISALKVALANLKQIPADQIKLIRKIGKGRNARVFLLRY